MDCRKAGSATVGICRTSVAWRVPSRSFAWPSSRKARSRSSVRDAGAVSEFVEVIAIEVRSMKPGGAWLARPCQEAVPVRPRWAADRLRRG